MAIEGVHRGLDEQMQSKLGYSNAAAPPEKGFEPTSAMQTQNSSTWGDRNRHSRTDPSSHFGPIFGGRCPSRPYRSGI